MNKIQNDDLDLFKLFKVLWDGKWLISIFMIIAILFGSILILNKTPIFTSYIRVSIDTIPAPHKLYEVSVDFNRMFYSETVLENWKTENNSAINYKDFSKRTIIDGFVMSEKDKKIATLVLRKKENSYILVRTDNLLQLNEFYNYANHISNALIPKYISKSKKELTLLEKRYKGKSNKHIIEKLFSFDKYINKLNDGGRVLLVEPPTIPVKVEPKPFRILGISVLLGLIIGIFYVLIQNASQNRKVKI